MTTRVVLADDHTAVRAGIRFLLQKAPDIVIVGEARDGLEAIRLAQELAPDVLLLDMEMPGLKGVEVARRLQAAGSPVRILALSTYDDRQYILGLLASGASGYLIKEEAPDILIEAVRGVARGEQDWVSRRVALRLATWLQNEMEQIELTNRETRVLRLIVAGKSTKEIEQTLKVSEKTVNRYLETIFAKLGVASRAEAAVHALQKGLV